MNVKRFIHIWTIAILFLLFDVNIAKAASSCPLDSVLTFNEDSVLTEVTIYDYVVDTPRTTVWTVNPDGSRIGKFREESYSSSLKTMTASYEWDNTVHKWKGTNKREIVYKSFAGSNKQISETTFTWLNAHWVADKRYTNNYDNAARTTEYYVYTRNTETNKLEPTSGYRYAWIDNNRKSMEEIYSTYSNGAWTEGTKQEWNYDAEGHQTLYAYYGSIVNGRFVGDSKEEWGFTDNVQTMHATYVWADVEWAGVLKEVLVNDSLGRATLHETYDWYNSDWSMTLREIAAFDEAGHQILIENYTGENGVPTGTQKEEYVYSGDTLILSIVYKWSASKINWIGSTYEKWEYNGPTGEKTYYEKQVWRNSAWGDSIQEIWEFNGPSNQQTLHEKYVWNKDAASLLPTLEYTDEYDSDDHLIRKEYYTFTNGVRVGKTYYTYTYENGKKTAYTVYAWENGAWVGDKNEIWEFNGPSNTQTRHEKTVCENGEWTTTLLEITSYTGSYATLKEKYELVNGVLTGTQKEVYTYTGSKKTEAITYDWINSAWENAAKETWAYSGNKVTKYELFTWNSDWVKTLEENTTYDGSNITSIVNYALLEGVWTGTKGEEYTFTDGKKTQEIIYTWVNGAWTYLTGESWEYTGGHLTSHEKSEYNGSSWSLLIREQTTYDGDNIVGIENYVYENGGWNVQKEEYVYVGSQKTETIIYAWGTNGFEKSTRSVVGSQEGNTTISSTDYIWNGSIWVGSGSRTYTTVDDENRVTELITQNWPDGATEWTNSTISQHTFNTDGVDILTYNASWNGVRWQVTSMTRLDIIIDDAGHTLLNASWKCAADSIWKGVQKDTTKYSTSGRLLYNARFTAWKNNNWTYGAKSYEVTYEYDAAGNTTLEQRYHWEDNSWQGEYKYEYEYDAAGNKVSSTTYNRWNTTTSTWVGNTKSSSVYNSKNQLIESMSYKWKNSRWEENKKNTFVYDAEGHIIEQITQNKSGNTWVNSLRYETKYEDNLLVKSNTYKWSNNNWEITEKNEYYFDNDAQSKLRREVKGIWVLSKVKSYTDKNYHYACDPMTIRFVNYDGTLLETKTVYKGDLPEYTGETPTKSDAANTYVFLGWTPAIVAGNGDATYTATFSASLNQYTVTFKNDDGTTLSSETLYHGATPTCAEPSKQADAQYTYTFGGWSPEVTTVTANVTYTATYTSTKNKYTITWLDDDDSSLGSTTVEYGKVPTHANPTKLNTAEYTYSFAGWDHTPVAVTGDATYKATYSAVKNSYTVTWRNEDNSLLGTTVLEYGVMPTHDDLTKTGTAQYSYTFAGWTPALAAVKGDATYTASFIQTTNRYTVTFKDDQGTTLDSRLWDYGLTPTCTPPTKEPDAENTYAFAGWEPQVTTVKADVIYTAVFTTIQNSYTITWLNDDDSQIDQTNVAYGAMPTHADPVKSNTAEYTYSFSGWTPSIVAATAEASYKATFTATKNKYTITWLEDDNTQIDQTSVEYGVVPTHVDPTKQGTAEYTYTFSGWDNEPIVVTGEATYKATYTSTKNSYSVTWLNDDGSELSHETLEYGITPTHADPVKTNTAEWTYSFISWTPAVTSVVGDAIYTAKFDTTKNSYSVTWLNDDGSELSHETLEYGTTPTPTDPVKTNTAEWTYSFIAWTPAVTSVVGDAIYTAKFDTTKNSYTVTWLDENESVLSSETLEYGATPTHEDPTKQPTAQYGYTFAGWSPAISAVTGNATYKAMYTDTINQYTISWLDDVGTLVDQTKVAYGSTPAHANIYKESDSQYDYTFVGWTPTLVPVTGDASYSAIFTTAGKSYTVTFYFEDGVTILDQMTLPYGAIPSTPYIPSIPSDANHTYTFSGWSPEIAPVTGDISYVPTFTAIPNQYTVIFRNYNGKELQRKKVDYGTIPEYEGDEPSRPATNSYTWAFEGWTPELTAVIGDATYTAVYTKVMNTYTILFYDEDGTTLLDEVTVEHGQKPTTSVIPIKEADEEYRYTFAGWSPKIAKATSDAEYTATYFATPKTQDLNNTEAEERATKVLIDDHIYILRSGHTYTLDGALVK